VLLLSNISLDPGIP